MGKTGQWRKLYSRCNRQKRISFTIIKIEIKLRNKRQRIYSWNNWIKTNHRTRLAWYFYQERLRKKGKKYHRCSSKWRNETNYLESSSPRSISSNWKQKHPITNSHSWNWTRSQTPMAWITPFRPCQVPRTCSNRQ